MKTKIKASEKESINKTSLSWLNPKTDHLIGYTRTHRLGISEKKDSICGFLNVNTHRLVGLNSARQLGIV